MYNHNISSGLISTAKVGRILGISIPSSMLKNLDFHPVAELGTSILWDRQQVPAMAQALANYFQDSVGYANLFLQEEQ